MLKYICYIIIGILIYLLWNGVEKFNVGALRALFEYNPTTSWQRTLYATQTDIDSGLVAGLVEGTDYELVDDYAVPAPEPLAGNFQFQVGDEGLENGTNLHDTYIQLNRQLVTHNMANPDNRINPPDDDANIGSCFINVHQDIDDGTEEGSPNGPGISEGVPPGCLVDLGYYQELQDGTEEILVAKLKETQKLFGTKNSACSAKQRFAFAFSANKYISDDLIEMIGQHMYRPATQYLRWQMDFTKYMINSLNTLFSQVIQETDENRLYRLSNHLSNRYGFGFNDILTNYPVGPNMGRAINSRIDNRLMFRLADTNRSFVELMYMFQLMVDELLYSLNLDGVDRENRDINLRMFLNNYLIYFIRIFMRGSIDRNFLSDKYTNNLKTLAIIFCLLFLMKTIAITAEVGDSPYDVNSSMIPYMQDFKFEDIDSDMIRPFRNGISTSRDFQTIFITMLFQNDDGGNVPFDTFDLNIYEIVQIVKALENYDLLNKENIIGLFYIIRTRRTHQPHVSASDIVYSFIRSVKSPAFNVHISDFELYYSSFEIPDINRMLILLIQLLFGSDG